MIKYLILLFYLIKIDIMIKIINKKYNTFDTAIGYNQGDLKRLKKESSVVMNVSNYVEGLLERE